MKKVLLLLVIAVLFAAGIVSPAVSAAGTADGKEVPDKGYVLLGETGLNFTTNFSEGGVYTWMEFGETADKKFSISNPGNVDIPNYIGTGPYYQAKSPGNWGTKYCVVASPTDFPVQFVDKDGKKIESASAGIDSPITLYLQGKPGATYDISVSGGGSVSPESGTMTRLSDKPTLTFTFTPPSSGSYTVKAKDRNSDETAEIKIGVGVAQQSVKVTISKLPDDAVSGIFASGDQILLSGSITNAESSTTPITGVYLYVTGMNLDANGVSLDDKEAVIDGDSSTFTSAKYDEEKHTWEYMWTNTGKFEPGTYTIYAVIETKGQLSALSTGVTPGSTEIYLSHPSVHVKFAEENGGLFTQGDVVYSFWSARGSPIGIRWYIIGPNFIETGINDKSNMWLYTADQEPGKDAPQGLYGFSYDRFFSRDLAAGNYYLVYQHPGFNGKFDVWPTSGNNYLETNFGESASLEGRPSSNCAEALETLINSAASDDLCVITDITIEPPYISIDQVEHLEIGEALKIKGTTNYAGEGVTADGTEVKNTFSLKVNRLDFDLAEENAAMQLQIVNRVVPKNIIPYYGERTYEFDEIDTSTWFEGTYQAVVTNIDTGFEESIMFTVGGEGFEADSSTLNVPSDPLAEPYEELEPLPPIDRYEDPTEPEEPKSPGFILAPLAFGLAFILRRK